MPYFPPKTRTFTTLAEATRFIEDELAKIAQAMQELVQLQELHVEPKRPRTGLLVLADGTDWDPGNGAGVYYYTGAAWQKLEEVP